MAYRNRLTSSQGPALLRNEYVTRGVPAVPDDVLTEIIDEVFLPLVHGRGAQQDKPPLTTGLGGQRVRQAPAAAAADT
jgi:hypothetical protein